jgi:hypothetical protein
MGMIVDHRHPGLDPGSITTVQPWIPGQARDDEGLETTGSGHGSRGGLSKIRAEIAEITEMKLFTSAISAASARII